VPDAVIISSCRLLIETKIKRNTVRESQLRRHLERLDGGRESTRLLLVLTPDDHEPAALEKIADPLLMWSSFATLDQSINELLNDPHEVVSEREAFLLRELQSMLIREELVATATDVVVVAARHAWPEYQQFHAYICQPDRRFQPVTRMAFYTGGRICTAVPKVLDVAEHVEFVPEQHPKPLRQFIERLVRETRRTEGQAYKIFTLSAPDSTETVHLKKPIVNDITTEGGRPWAFTLGQRYVPLEGLEKANKTSELVNERQ
jgi:hypothetical protein